ncbi:MAG TPA: tRNA (adenosine(37)-N6)-threonylcarbamoyltransferase complex transferase subunit TsaD [Verrucomicrobiae bacterium]|nr:tRNA (adenosine(37)-N6)-threonylcarbamoyltransferase complex transferase subunit TsaD [Verrucomicrobiae bacterium]
MKILGVETSCDETSAAVVREGHEILSNIVSSQIALHRPYGGVVPELASRNHLQLIDAVIREALAESHSPIEQIDAVAATYAPGLASSLLIGLNAAKGIAFAAGRPFIGINHLEAHLYSPLLVPPWNSSTLQRFNDLFPMISLIVSGGHTILARATAIGEHEILGQTVDDAAGEAFDKVAKLLGLGYPGGPEIERLAAQGDPAAIAFPRSMLQDPTYNFSFSGLKTAVLYYLRKHPSSVADHQLLADICASFQEAIVDVLVGKMIRAATEFDVTTLSASGGVSVNRRFREKLGSECTRRGWQLLLAPPGLCTDNAAMIAALAYHKLRDGQRSEYALDVFPSIGLGRGTIR